MSKMKRKIEFSAFARQYGVLLIFILMIIIGSLISPVFFTGQNLINILKQNTPIVVIACGATLIIISGQIDLGAGSVAALTGTVSVGAYLATGSLALAIIAALGVGIITGGINGFLITRYSLPPFIVTLAMQLMARGAALLFTSGLPLPIYDDGFKILGQGTLGVVPISVIIMLSTVAINLIILNKLRFGRYIYAVGGNQDAALASGVNVKLVKRVAFIIAGIYTSIAGILLMSRMNVGQPNAGVNYEFDAIIGVIIGGASFNGGIGNAYGSLIGCLMVGVLSNTLNLLNVSPYIQMVVKGVIIVLAVVMDVKSKKIRLKNS